MFPTTVGERAAARRRLLEAEPLSTLVSCWRFFFSSLAPVPQRLSFMPLPRSNAFWKLSLCQPWSAPVPQRLSFMPTAAAAEHCASASYVRMTKMSYRRATVPATIASHQGACVAATAASMLQRAASTAPVPSEDSEARDELCLWRAAAEAGGRVRFDNGRGRR